MANWSGIAATLSSLVRPAQLRPHLVVPSLAQLDWSQLRTEAKVDAVVLDKDNCIARPHEDQLAENDALRESWQELLQAFGPERVLVVSNSAGDLRKDPLLLQAESVSRNLGVPVLVHPHPKPASACAHQIAAHFLPPPHVAAPSTSQIVFSPLARARAKARREQPLRLRQSDAPAARTLHPQPLRVLVVGDRLATDMILASRLSRLRLPLSLSLPAPTEKGSRRRGPKVQIGVEGQRIEAVGVLTTQLWAREGFGTTAMRAVERMVVRRFQRQKRREGEGVDWTRYTVGIEQPKPSVVAHAPRLELASRLVPTTLGEPAPQPRPRSSVPLTSRLRLPDPSTLLSSLRSLPTTLPARLTSLLHSLPQLVHDTTTALFLRLLRAVEQRLPRWVERGEQGMSRAVRVWKPTPPEGEETKLREGREVQRVGTAGGTVERWAEAVESRWDEAGRTWDRWRSAGLGSAVGLGGKKEGSGKSRPPLRAQKKIIPTETAEAAAAEGR